MKELKFKTLTSNEIEVRPTDTKYKGKATLLLYQDARCGMNALDSIVGKFNWQKRYEEVAGVIYCGIAIKNTETNEWIWKYDCGTKSNIEAEKGEASDSFKRACVNWGIGRELYTAPVIKINCPDSYYYNDKFTMTFKVKDIAYNADKISKLIIVDKFNKEVFNWTEGKTANYAVNKPQDNNENLEYTEEEYKSSKFTQQDFIKWCSKKIEEGAERKQVERFYTFWTSPSKYVEGKKTFEAIKGGFNVEDKWETHINKAS